MCLECDGVCSETWALRIEDARRLEQTEMMMVRMMCGVALKQRLSSQDFLQRMGIDNVSSVMRISRLSWFGHVEHMPVEDWVSHCRSWAVKGTRGRVKELLTFITFETLSIPMRSIEF